MVYHSRFVLTRRIAPVVLAWDPNTAHARELDMEERLRRLESLARPPQYNS
jgi:hypothetical protein